MKKIDATLRKQIEVAFAPLNTAAAANAFPAPASLSDLLYRIHTAGPNAPAHHRDVMEAARMFTTASVDMWLRAVHSFLVSTSLTNVSPTWASVAGYYSSHYSVRAFAHLLGFFQSYNIKRIVRIELQSNGTYVCKFERKRAGDREHSIYWRIVKKDPHFAADPFFTDNAPGDVSDASHRERANYADHLPQFPIFRPLDREALKQRVERISEIETLAPPIPSVSRYPDLESVQIVAYHRLVRFRSLLDAVVVENRFWLVHREPAWARGFVDYQLTEEGQLRSFTS